MPLRFYAPLASPCRLCGLGFEQRQATDEPDLTSCDRCGQAVHLVGLQRANTPKLSAPLSVSRARQAGFTVFKRTSGGGLESR